VHAPERLHGLRVVSTPAALDHARIVGDALVLRIASDELIAFGATSVDVDDPYAIVEHETTFQMWELTPTEFAEHVVRHIEWTLPSTRPALAQGLVAGVALKLWLDHDRVLLIASSGLVHEVADRLGVPA
jgi:hypothetical protein